MEILTFYRVTANFAKLSIFAKCTFQYEMLSIHMDSPPSQKVKLTKCKNILLTSVQSVTQICLFATPWNAAHQASLSITKSWSLLKLMSIKLVMSSNHLILCNLLLLLPLIFPSIRVFSKEPVFHIRWPKYWRFSFSISPSTDYSELIYFRMDWLGLLKSLFQHHSSKAPIL